MEVDSFQGDDKRIEINKPSFLCIFCFSSFLFSYFCSFLFLVTPPFSLYVQFILMLYLITDSIALIYVVIIRLHDPMT